MINLFYGYITTVISVFAFMLLVIRTSPSWVEEVERYSDNTTFLVINIFLAALLWPLFILLAIFHK